MRHRTSRAGAAELALARSLGQPALSAKALCVAQIRRLPVLLHRFLQAAGGALCAALLRRGGEHAAAAAPAIGEYTSCPRPGPSQRLSSSMSPWGAHRPTQ